MYKTIQTIKMNVCYESYRLPYSVNSFINSLYLSLLSPHLADETVRMKADCNVTLNHYKSYINVKLLHCYFSERIVQSARAPAVYQRHAARAYTAVNACHHQLWKNN